MTRQFRKLAHSLYECKYHIVFCPKYRYKILQSEVANYVKQQIHRLSHERNDVEVLEVNVQADHVHLVVAIAPKYAVSQYMGFLKGKLALRLFDRFPYQSGTGDSMCGHVDTVRVQSDWMKNKSENMSSGKLIKKKLGN